MAVVVSIVSTYSGKGVRTAITDLASFQKAANIAGGGFVGNMKAAGAYVDALGTKVSTTGRSLTSGLTVPLVAAGYGLYKTTQSASDLAETISKTNVIFGDSAKAIESWAATADTKLGQSKQQAMDAASNFAIFGKSAGLTGDDLVKFSTGLTGVTADMASFANTTPEEAITAVSAALRGESEPIRKYGVLLNEATLRNEALTLGLVKNTKTALTPQQRVLAAQSAIYKQLGKDGSNTIGDFERTSGGLANQQRILKAQLANTSTEIGQQLLPIALDLVKAFRTQVLPVIQGLVDKFRSLSPETKKYILIAGALLAALGPVLLVVGKVISVVGKFISVIGQVGKAFMWLSKLFMANPWALLIVAVVALAIVIYKNWDKIKAFLVKAWETIKEKASAFWEALKGGFQRLVDGIATFFTTMKDKVVSVVTAVGTWLWDHSPLVMLYRAIRDYLPTVIAWLKELPGKLIAALGNIKDRFLQIGSDLVAGIKQGILNGWSAFKSWFMNLIGSPIQWAKDKLGISSPSKQFAYLGQMITAGLTQGMDPRLVAARTDEMMSAVLGNAQGSVGITASGIAAGSAPLGVSNTSSGSAGGGATMINVSQGAVVVQVSGGGDPAAIGSAVKSAVADALAKAAADARRKRK